MLQQWSYPHVQLLLIVPWKMLEIGNVIRFYYSSSVRLLHLYYNRETNFGGGASLAWLYAGCQITSKVATQYLFCCDWSPDLFCVHGSLVAKKKKSHKEIKCFINSYFLVQIERVLRCTGIFCKLSAISKISWLFLSWKIGCWKIDCWT